MEVSGSETRRSPEDAAFFVQWIDRLIVSAGARTEWNAPYEREAVMKTPAEARAIFSGVAFSDPTP